MDKNRYAIRGVSQEIEECCAKLRGIFSEMEGVHLPHESKGPYLERANELVRMFNEAKLSMEGLNAHLVKLVEFYKEFEEKDLESFGISKEHQ